MFTGLWRDRNFLRLWSAQSVSLFGTHISFLALPLVAIITLDATPLQMGLLAALGALPALFIGPFVGAWADRRRRRPLMIASDWGRVGLIALIPLAWLLDFLSIELLFGVAMGAGTLALVFDVAYRSYLPTLVGRGQLVDANSKLELGRSGAEVAGPSVAGLIIQLASAPVALIVDAVSFAISALFLHSIRVEERDVGESDEHGSLFSDAREGIRFVWSDRALRALILNVTSIALFSAALEAVNLLYAVNALGISAGLIGLIAGSGGVGFIIGALVSRRIIDRLGTGRAIIAAVLFLALSDLLWPVVGGDLILIVVLLALGQVAFGFSQTIFNVAQVSLRQQIAPDRFQGRMHAAFRVALGAGVPVGALLGGALGEVLDLRTALFIAVAGEAAAVVWIIASPIRSIRTNARGSDND